MFSNVIRDFKILLNHKRRVGSIVIRPNEEIVRAMDWVRDQYLEAERKEDKENTLRFKSKLEIFEWLINEDKRTA